MRVLPVIKWCILSGMTASSKSVPEKGDRNERLAAALRENLKRRKAQARAQNRVRQDGAKTETQPPKSPAK
ncbi:hypothetical protein RSO01_66040 [Reyranella soli]|uniref:Uncharacterized protein n=2 Tax=Reyranella soli TaxID=1230389 RepID=A0A512NKF7_9HYPH|nr:hypothetical protein RSO01_66040 [Reyranella soli]